MSRDCPSGAARPQGRHFWLKIAANYCGLIWLRSQPISCAVTLPAALQKLPDVTNWRRAIRYNRLITMMMNC